MDPEPGNSELARTGKRSYAILYDQTCPICRSAVARLRVWDTGNRLDFLSGSDLEVAVRFPWLSATQIEKSIHLVGPEGEVWEGAEAVEKLVRLLPRWRWTSRIFDLPLIRPMARKMYRWVARHRYVLSCGRHCGVQRPESPKH